MTKQVLFTKEDLREALAELARRLRERGVSAGIRIVGGAALALAYYDRQPTIDIDALIYPSLEAEGPVLEMVATMAAEHGWPGDWLNSNVKVHAPPALDAAWRVLFVEGDISVQIAPPDLLLAMKLNAARGVRDARDIDVLLELCEIRDLESAEAVFEHYYPGDALSEKAIGAVKRHLSPDG
ncbi:MAG: hypothetical protein ABI807_06795 [Sporichthyaceae bacterium]